MEDKPFECFDSILKEVVAADFDQLVMLSRASASHIYMLSKGRVKKGITFERDVTAAFVEYFSGKELREPEQTLEFKLNLATSTPSGKCFSVKITKRA